MSRRVLGACKLGAMDMSLHLSGDQVVSFEVTVEKCHIACRSILTRVVRPLKRPAPQLTPTGATSSRALRADLHPHHIFEKNLWMEGGREAGWLMVTRSHSELGDPGIKSQSAALYSYTLVSPEYRHHCTRLCLVTTYLVGRVGRPPSHHGKV